MLKKLSSAVFLLQKLRIEKKFNNFLSIAFSQAMYKKKGIQYLFQPAAVIYDKRYCYFKFASADKF